MSDFFCPLCDKPTHAHRNQATNNLYCTACEYEPVFPKDEATPSFRAWLATTPGAANDHFTPALAIGYTFPCWACVYCHRGATAEPCCGCVHNAARAVGAVNA
jgi:hypothetical protein